MVEVVVASSILLTCLISLSSLLSGAITGSAMSQLRDQATNVANQRIEDARNLPFDDVGVYYAGGLQGNPPGSILTPDHEDGFTIETAVTWIRTSTGRAAYKRFDVTVSWTSPAPGHVEVTTMITGHSDVVTSGDFDVLLRYREDGTPVVDAPVVLQTSDGQTTGVTSDADGEAFFGQATIGTCSVSVTPPSGYIVDTSTLSSMTVAADSLSTFIVYLQKPAQAIVSATDTSGTPLAGATVSLVGPNGQTIPAGTTGADGDATFSDLVYGAYSATLTKPGYTGVTQPFTFNIGTTNLTVPFRMSPIPTAGLRVCVFDNNGTQLPGASVSVLLNGTVIPNGSGVTGTNGEVSFSPAPATYQVTVADSPTYLSQTKTDVVNPGDVDELDFYLSVATHGGNMHVTTEDKHGNPLSLRTVVSGPGYYRNDLYSDSTGSLWLYNLAAGSYSVSTYTRPASTVTVLVNSNQTTEVTVNQK